MAETKPGNRRYWDQQEEIFEDHLDPATLAQYEQRELEDAINKYGRIPLSVEKSPYYGIPGHNGPATLSLKGPKGISRGVKTMVERQKLMPSPKQYPLPRAYLSKPPDVDPRGDDTYRAPGGWLTGAMYGLILDQPGVGSPDYEWWIKWTETFPYRYECLRTDEVVIPGYDNKLELWRASRNKKGWKWWLLHFTTLPGVNEDEVVVYAEPFTRPSLVHVHSRGLFSSESFQPRRSSGTLLKQLEKNAELRWQGIPMTEKEKREDRDKLREKIWVEGIRNHYGFLGHAICNASAEMHSSVYVLFCMLLSIWSVVFCFGPVSLAGMLSELLVGVIPCQNALAGILAMKSDAELRDVRYEVKWTIGGDARQWLVYFPFYQVTGMMVGWVYISRPSWYWWALAWRTVVLVACGSPYFGAFNYAGLLSYSIRKAEKSRRLGLIWTARGKKRQNEVILRPPLREQKLKANFLRAITSGEKASAASAKLYHNKSMGDPERGEKVEYSMEFRGQDLKKKAIQMLGFLEEYCQIADPKGNVNKKSGSSAAQRIKDAIVGLDEMNEELKNASETEEQRLQKKKDAEAEGDLYEPPKRRFKDKFKAYKDVETALTELEGAIMKAYGLMRTTPGGYGLQQMLKDRYGATDREAADYMNTFYYEIGSKMSRENGIDAAFKHKTLRDAWKGELYQTLGLEGEPELKHLPWEREYDHSALPGKWSALPDMTEVAKKYQQGDPKTRQIWDDYKVRQAWNEELKAVDPELWNEDFDQPRLPKDMPWNAAYESRSVENILDDQESAGKSYFQRRPFRQRDKDRINSPKPPWRNPAFPTRRWGVFSDKHDEEFTKQGARARGEKVEGD